MKPAAVTRHGSASSEGSNYSVATVRTGSVDGAVDDVPTIVGHKRGRGLQVDSKSDARDDSLHREVRRASMSCRPGCEAVLTASPTDDVPISSGLQTVMDEASKLSNE